MNNPGECGMNLVCISYTLMLCKGTNVQGKKEAQWVYELQGRVNQEHETTITSFSDTTTIFFIEEEDLDAWLTTSISH